MSAKDVWALSDSWSDDTGWIEGSVEIKASELAGDTIFRVIYYFEINFYLFSIIYSFYSNCAL